jgi:hypothetical protein
MPNLLNTSSIMMCPHGGTVSAITRNTQAKAAGGALLRASDTFTIAGCSLASLPTPSPCLQVKWVQANGKSQAREDFTLSENSVGQCMSGEMGMQGSVQILSTQTQGSGL